MQIICMRAVYRGRPNNTPIRGKHPTPIHLHTVKQTSTTNPQNTPQHSQQCSGCTYYAISRKTLCNCGCVRVCVCENEWSHRLLLPPFAVKYINSPECSEERR